MKAIRGPRGTQSRTTSPALPPSLLAAALCGLLCACGSPGDSAGGSAAAAETAPAQRDTARVVPGIDVVVRDGGGPLKGLRVGLITNPTGQGADGTSDIDLLAKLKDVRLVALFGPEHGLRGTAEAGATVENGRDPVTGLPVYSLYGKIREPTPRMLQDLDALVFDIQDVGARYYTYVWTMALAMKAAAKSGVKFVVLDRPNPIGGRLVQGDVLDTAYATFVGLYPVPMRHGLTVGEMARWLNATYAMGADLDVVPVEGWTRDMWYDETGLPWVAPSPNMPTLESAASYPGTCLFEGTNLSVGRGTPIAFQHVGAPWVDADTLAARLQARSIPGVRFEATSFTPEKPGDDKYGGTEVHGVRFVLTDRTTYDPTAAAVAALVELHRLYPSVLTFRESHFDRLAGTDGVRKAVLAGEDAAAIMEGWAAQRQAFESEVRPFLLYR